MVGKTNVSGAKLFAAIGVTYPAGSTVTCTNGTKTMKAKNTSGQWVFAIPETGTWTVTATDGTNSKSETVSITAEGQSVNVELSYALYIFKAGTGRNDSYPITTYEVENENANEIGTNNSDAGSAYCTKSKIDVSGYSKLHVDMVCTGRYNSSYSGTIGVGNDASTGVNSIGSLSASKTGIYNTNRTVHTVDISSINTAVYIKIDLYAVAHRIYNWWLE